MLSHDHLLGGSSLTKGGEVLPNWEENDRRVYLFCASPQMIKQVPHIKLTKQTIENIRNVVLLHLELVHEN
jgi:hypothetical protein